MLALIFTYDLLNEVFRLSYLELGQERVLNISILRVEILYCVLLHECETVRNIDSSLMDLAFYLTIFYKLLSQLFELLLLYSILLGETR